MKRRKSGRVHGARETTTEDFCLPIVDPDFLIMERDPDKLHRFARGLLNRLRNPSRSYSVEMVKAATVWLVGAYVDAQIPLAPEMSAVCTENLNPNVAVMKSTEDRL